jgi:hypothetical protein
LIVICILLLSAFFIRLYHINRPPMDFGTVRQYQQAHIARGYYFEGLDTIPEWKAEIAKLNQKRMGFMLEPRILETLAVVAYRLTGGERLWIPRMLSSLFWIVGGIFLFLIARKIASEGAAVFAAAFYLLLPFGISSSRSFQPDPLMVAMIIISIYGVLQYFEKPSVKRLVIASLLTAFAIFVKPYSVFLVYITFLVNSLFRNGLRKTVFNIHSYVFAVISLLPMALYYFSALMSDVGYMREHAQNSFVPHIMVNAYFWKDWFMLIGDVIGYFPFFLGLLGLFLMRPGFSRIFLVALWAGYIIFGIAATHHIHTHNYYHMQFIPVVALSLAPVWDRFMESVLSKKYPRIFAVAVLTLVLSVVSSVGTNLSVWRDDSAGLNKKVRSLRSIVGLNPEFKHFLMDDFQKKVRDEEEIGEIIGHSANTIFLTKDFGRSLAYHGELSGLPWPTQGSLLERKERGLRIPSKEELFHPDYFIVRTHNKYIKYAPDYFIITYFSEYERQKDLKEFLTRNFPIIAKKEGYLIFDLRKMSGT